jgi:hypothetical protein
MICLSKVEIILIDYFRERYQIIDNRASEIFFKRDNIIILETPIFIQRV